MILRRLHTLVLVIGIAGTLAAPQGADTAGATTGRASWFNSYGPGLYAAVPGYRWGQPRYQVRVCRADRPTACVVVTVRDACFCRVGKSVRVVDLSRDAFSRLANPAVGLVRVTLRRLP